MVLACPVQRLPRAPSRTPSRTSQTVTTWPCCSSTNTSAHTRPPGVLSDVHVLLRWLISSGTSWTATERWAFSSLRQASTRAHVLQQPVPAVLEIPSKDRPYDPTKARGTGPLCWPLTPFAEGLHPGSREAFARGPRRRVVGRGTRRMKRMRHGQCDHRPRCLRTTELSQE